MRWFEGGLRGFEFCCFSVGGGLEVLIVVRLFLFVLGGERVLSVAGKLPKQSWSKVTPSKPMPNPVRKFDPLRPQTRI